MRAGKAERQWKQCTDKGSKTKEEISGEEEAELRRFNVQCSASGF